MQQPSPCLLAAEKQRAEHFIRVSALCANLVVTVQAMTKPVSSEASECDAEETQMDDVTLLVDPDCRQRLLMQCLLATSYCGVHCLVKVRDCAILFIFSRVMQARVHVLISITSLI